MNKTKNVNKVFLGIIGSLALGIIGSALWEWVFSPLFTASFRLINNYLISTSQNYSNDLYRMVSYGTEQFHVNQQYVISLLTTIIALLLSFLIAERCNSFMKNRYILAMFFMVTILVLFFASLWNLEKRMFAARISLSCADNIEVVAPYISDVEYKFLRSRFRLIETKSDYDSLIVDINEIAESNNVKLKQPLP